MVIENIDTYILRIFSSLLTISLYIFLSNLLKIPEIASTQIGYCAPLTRRAAPPLPSAKSAAMLLSSDGGHILHSLQTCRCVISLYSQICPFSSHICIDYLNTSIYLSICLSFYLFICIHLARLRIFVQIFLLES